MLLGTKKRTHRFFEPVRKDDIKEQRMQRDVRERIARGLLSWSGFYPSYAFKADPPIEQKVRKPARNVDEIEAAVEPALEAAVEAQKKAADAAASADPVSRATHGMRAALVRQRVYLRDAGNADHGLVTIDGRTYVGEWLEADSQVPITAALAQAQAQARTGELLQDDTADINSSLESAMNVKNDRMEWRSNLGMDIPESEEGVKEEPEDELTREEAVSWERVRQRMAKNSPKIAEALRQEQEQQRAAQAAARAAQSSQPRKSKSRKSQLKSVPQPLNVEHAEPSPSTDNFAASVQEDISAENPRVRKQAKVNRKRDQQQGLRDRLLGWVRNL